MPGMHAPCVLTRVKKQPHLLTLVTSSPTSSTMPMNSAGQHSSTHVHAGPARTQHGSTNGLAHAATSCMGSFKVALLRPAASVCGAHTLAPNAPWPSTSPDFIPGRPRRKRCRSLPQMAVLVTRRMTSPCCEHVVCRQAYCMRVGASEQHFAVGCVSVLVLWQKQLGLCAACACRAHVVHVPTSALECAAGRCSAAAACRGAECAFLSRCPPCR